MSMHHRVSPSTGWVILGLAALTPAPGCQWFRRDLGGQEPAVAVAPGEPEFVYPDEPAVVDRAALGSMLSRLGSEYALLWAMTGQHEDDAAIAAMLAGNRESFRAAGIQLVALHPGEPAVWQEYLLPMLRNAKANFLCVLADADERGVIGRWIGGGETWPEEGLYLINLQQEVVARLAAEPGRISAYASTARLDGAAGLRLVAAEETKAKGGSEEAMLAAAPHPPGKPEGTPSATATQPASSAGP